MGNIDYCPAVELRFIGELPRAETSQIIVSHTSCTRVCIDLIFVRKLPGRMTGLGTNRKRLLICLVKFCIADNYTKAICITWRRDAGIKQGFLSRNGPNGSLLLLHFSNRNRLRYAICWTSAEGGSAVEAEIEKIVKFI